MLVAAACTLAAYAALEAAWLTSMRGFYGRQFALFARDGRLRVRSVPAAALTYIAIAAALSLFVLAPLVRDTTANDNSNSSTVMSVALKGAALGAAIYGVYNGTNMATLPGYTWTMVAVDTAWGAASVGAAAAVFAWVLLLRF
jgi:uncharacterized membrane protein